MHYCTYDLVVFFFRYDLVVLTGRCIHRSSFAYIIAFGNVTIPLFVMPFCKTHVPCTQTLQPRINRFEVIYHTMVTSGFKLVRVKELHVPFLPTGSDRLNPLASPYFNMNHVVLLFFTWKGKGKKEGKGEERWERGGKKGKGRKEGKGEERRERGGKKGKGRKEGKGEERSERGGRSTWVQPLIYTCTCTCIVCATALPYHPWLVINLQ